MMAQRIPLDEPTDGLHAETDSPLDDHLRELERGDRSLTWLGVVVGLLSFAGVVLLIYWAIRS